MRPTPLRTVASGRSLATAPVGVRLPDLMMQGEDGLSVRRRLGGVAGRAHAQRPGRDRDRIVGLEAGADDHLPKRFEPCGLLARVRALSRRREAGGDAAPATLLFAGWRFALAELRVDDQAVGSRPLTAGEAALPLADEMLAGLSNSELRPASPGR